MPTPHGTTTDRNLAYAFLRVLLGVNIGLHGISRIYAGAGAFAGELVGQFAKTPLPSHLVYFFGLSLPFAEGAIGILVLFGCCSRFAYCTGFLVMIALTFGSALRQDWTAAGWQLLYGFAYAALLSFREYNLYSADGMWKSKSSL